MTNINIDKYVKKFKDDFRNGQDGRYASFDYCFNYFQTFKEAAKTEDIVNNDNLQKSCLQLGFYLASWGMYRGSSSILQHSCHFLKKPLAVIAECDKQIWEIDVDEYTPENIELLLECGKKIQESLQNNVTKHKSSDTLVTKIMLGIFGNVPAYDTYFKKAMTEYGMGGTLNKKSLKKIGEFYEENKDMIDKLSEETKTIDFLNGSRKNRNYTKAKIIDMFGFQKGFENDKKNDDKQKKVGVEEL